MCKCDSYFGERLVNPCKKSIDMIDAIDSRNLAELIYQFLSDTKKLARKGKIYQKPNLYEQ